MEMGFVPGGQAGEQSARMTHEAEIEAEAKAAQRLADSNPDEPKRPSLIKRVLQKIRRAH
jgi:hypothetical protein